MWKYDSPIGTLYIKYIPSEHLYGLYYDGICWEACDTPQAEADNVFMHCTGCSEWDLTKDVPDCPTNISEWDQC